MDMQATIFWKHRDDLLRIMAVLWQMAGLGRGTTIRRSLHRIVTRLLRPAEAAARRLIVVLAARIEITLKPRRSADPHPNRLPVGENMHADLAHEPGWKNFALADPSVGWPELEDEPAPFPGMEEPREDSQVDATRLASRLDALCHALDDLNAQAHRLARWTALRKRARERGASCAIRPLRPGPPVDLRGSAGRRLRKHELHHILKDAHERARWAEPRPPDTS